jgi:hypothetical protein
MARTLDGAKLTAGVMRRSMDSFFGLSASRPAPRGLGEKPGRQGDGQRGGDAERASRHPVRRHGQSWLLG